MTKFKKKELIKKFLNRLFNGKLIFRRLILIILDIFLIIGSLICSSLLVGDGTYLLFSKEYFWILPILLFNALIIYFFTGQYRGISRYVGTTSSYSFVSRNITLISSIFLVGKVFNFNVPKVSQFFILLILLIISTGGLRIILRDLFINLKLLSSNTANVVIYGAGEAGAQLEAALKLAGNKKVICFVDDNNSLQGRYLNGKKIISPLKLGSIKNRIDQILLAIPSIKKVERREIINKIQDLNLPILQIPSIDEIASGASEINKLKPIKIEDLLGRDSVLPYQELGYLGFRDKSICVTGAGGSIGSELCRQICLLNPKKLIILDNNEPSIYKINQDISRIYSKQTFFKAVLGDVCDYSFLKKLFLEEEIDIVFHAAAYKHVPIVENNPLSGIKNNVFSTFSIINACNEVGLEKFILISTDKAVRPSNVMGASKRLSEQIVQAFASAEKKQTKYAMVRFGNVLGSSGSVVPLFEKQINNGGPITVTHPDVTRYFMTIKEAVHLVLHASAMANKGEVFLLKMGDPIRIVDLAKQMIKLSGLSIKNTKNPDGDIEILFTGLRPGEKLFEELLINAESENTKNSLIFKANENFIQKKELIPCLLDLKKYLDLQDEEKSLRIIHSLVPEWKS